MESLSPLEKQFIRDHLTDDVRQLVLRPQPANLDIRKLAAQLAARQKTRDKLPSWYANEEVLYPPALSVEQASSEQTARYKASLVAGDQLIDLTGGMGVDTWAFGQRVRRVTYVDRQADLVQHAAHNLPVMGTPAIDVRLGDGLSVVAALPGAVDWLYLDPHRRDGQGGKVVRLADCEPDVSNPAVVSELLTKAAHILLKTSPIIDIEATIRQLTGPAGHPDAARVDAVHVVAVQGEVKEVLFVLSRSKSALAAIEINAVNLLTDRVVRLQFTPAEERASAVVFGDPQTFLYEPNAAVLKAGAFRLVADRYGLTKLAPNSHLYTSLTHNPDVPGRSFVLDGIIKPDRNSLRTVLPSMKANLTVRNFPQTVAELRKKLNLQEGGDVYIFATTLLNGDKRLLLTRKADAVARS
ncbi:THUMP-like domain-containing protein [Spirosoma rigui]|uniref:THUMP-like domain-containing protein n=1 Tax=Spirosoma rigui TaxID=564064 RepID=UPI0009AF58B9|nr:SAM-dependent methyltransferase [Spirosoma rigui]